MYMNEVGGAPRRAPSVSRGETGAAAVEFALVMPVLIMILFGTINFGIAPLSGTLVSKLEMIDLEQMLRQAIIDFEPRILPDSLVVRGVAPVDPLGHHNSLSFEINARLWAQPYPLELLLKTDLDLETGLVELKDRSGTTILGA